MRKTISNLPTKHSCGFDGISAKLLKVIEPVILKSLTLLINQVLYSGIFPDKLKIAKVIPIFKKDDPSLFENYRPISLLPTIPKVLEKQIFIQLYSYFNENNFLNDNQYGFRAKYSTEYATIELIDRIVNKMDNKLMIYQVMYFLTYQRHLTVSTITFYKTKLISILWSQWISLAFVQKQKTIY